MKEVKCRQGYPYSCYLAKATAFPVIKQRDELPCPHLTFSMIMSIFFFLSSKQLEKFRQKRSFLKSFFQMQTPCTSRIRKQPSAALLTKQIQLAQKCNSSCIKILPFQSEGIHGFIEQLKTVNFILKKCRVKSKFSLCKKHWVLSVLYTDMKHLNTSERCSACKVTLKKKNLIFALRVHEKHFCTWFMQVQKLLK